MDDSSGFDVEDLNELKKQQEILNSLSDEQQIMLLQQLQNYQEQLNMIQQRLNEQNKNGNINLQNSQNQGQVTDQISTQFHQPQQNYQVGGLNQNQEIQQSNQQQAGYDNQQLEQLRQLQMQLLREQQLEQQYLQLTQQAQNLKQHQNLASGEQQNSYQDQNSQQQSVAHNVNQQSLNLVGDRTEGSQYSPGGGNTIGVGINVGIKPPAVDVQVTKPGSSGIKPLPPIFNPIAPKPIPAAPVAEPLVPLGIFPKPMLNLKGRLFFGAEMGKGAGIKAGR